VDLIFTISRFIRFAQSLFELVAPHAIPQHHRGSVTTPAFLSDGGGGSGSDNSSKNGSISRGLSSSSSSTAHDQSRHCAVHLASVLAALWRDYVSQVAVVGDEVALAGNVLAAGLLSRQESRPATPHGGEGYRPQQTGADAGGDSLHNGGGGDVQSGSDHSGATTPRSLPRQRPKPRLSSESRGHRFRSFALLTSDPGTPQEISFASSFSDAADTYITDIGYHSGSSLEPQGARVDRRRRRSGDDAVAQVLGTPPTPLGPLSPQFTSSPNRPSRVSPSPTAYQCAGSSGNTAPRRLSSSTLPGTGPRKSSTGGRSRRASLVDMLGPVPPPPIARPPGGGGQATALDAASRSFCTRLNTIYACIRLLPELATTLSPLMMQPASPYSSGGTASAAAQGDHRAVTATMEGLMHAHIQTFVGRVLLRATRLIRRVFQVPKIGDIGPPPTDMQPVTEYMNGRLISLSNALQPDVFTMVLDCFWMYGALFACGAAMRRLVNPSHAV